jgi:hypothetical protein
MKLSFLKKIKISNINRNIKDFELPNKILKLTFKSFSRRNIYLDKINNKQKLSEIKMKISSNNNNNNNDNSNNNQNQNKKQEDKLEKLESNNKIGIEIETETETNKEKEKENKLKTNNLNFNENKDKEIFNQEKYNIYLKVLSTLSKLENIDQEEFKDKLLKIKGKTNIKDIEDEDILSLISSYQENLTDKNQKTLTKIIEEEVSEEEFAENEGIRFRRPPHTLEELKKTLEEADKIFDENKTLFLGKSQEDLENMEKDFLKNIPKHIKFNVLNYPSNNCDIVLLGVNRFSNVHSLYVSNFIEKYEPECIGIEFHPDDPIFIQGDKSHLEEWKNFLEKNIDYKFKVNPLPKNVNDAILSPKKIESLIENNIDKNQKMKLTPKLIFTDNNFLNIQQNVGADAFLTPLLHSYFSRLDNYCPIVISDYPKLQYMDRVAKKISSSEMKNIFKIYLDSISNNNFYFDYKLLNYEIFLEEKITYMVEILRQMSFSNKKIVFVMDYKYQEHFIEHWRKLEKKINPLENFYKEFNNKTKKPQEFVDYIENLIMLDLLEDGFIFENFVNFKVIYFIFIFSLFLLRIFLSLVLMKIVGKLDIIVYLKYGDIMIHIIEI